jgi:ubiquinone/menaquinone biosynthesis C-methylase UbiE
LQKKKIPHAKFLKKDMMKMNFPENSFDIIISILAILHIPKRNHKKLFRDIYKIIKPKGRILIGMTTSNDGDYTNEWVNGVKMFWSTSSKEENLNLIRGSGFKIIWTKELGPKNDKHIYILAKK